MAEWFEEWFGNEYLELYPHRNQAEADRAIALIRRTLPWVPGWRVLDVACGAGRHARALEQAGARPVGLDLSWPLLVHARAHTAAPLVRADMRAVPIRAGSVDLAVNLFTSFGYFDDDAEHRLALAEMTAPLRRHGWFVIDFLNADTVIAGLVPEERVELGGRSALVTRAIGAGRRFVVKTIRTDDGREFVERVRLFTPDEIETLLADCGIAVRHRFGDYDGGPLEPGSPRTILMGQPA